jgi:hypothetical protein
MARRYGKLPSQLLRLPVDEWTIDLAVLLAGLDEDDQRKVKEAEALAKTGCPMAPLLALRG